MTARPLAVDDAVDRLNRAHSHMDVSTRVEPGSAVSMLIDESRNG
jgi:hypothetical protein